MPSRFSTSRPGTPTSRRKRPGGSRRQWPARGRSCAGTLAIFGSEHGDEVGRERLEPRLSPPPRIVGVSGERMVLLRRPEVRFAEADGNDVWLVTEEGRLQAAVHGIDRLEDELTGGEF